jgi:hypothetical protein
MTSQTSSEQPEERLSRKVTEFLSRRGLTIVSSRTTPDGRTHHQCVPTRPGAEYHTRLPGKAPKDKDT